MDAKVGDQMLIGGGQAAGGRFCEVLEIMGDNGPRRYLVRWLDTGSQGLVLADRGDVVVSSKAA